MAGLKYGFRRLNAEPSEGLCRRPVCSEKQRDCAYCFRPTATVSTRIPENADIIPANVAPDPNAKAVAANATAAAK